MSFLLRRICFFLQVGLLSFFAGYACPGLSENDADRFRSLNDICQNVFKTKKAAKTAHLAGLMPYSPGIVKMARVATHSYKYKDPSLTDPLRTMRKTLVADVPRPTEETRLINLNQFSHFDHPPSWFLVADGTLNRTVTLVDLSPNSPLTRHVDQIVRHIRMRLGYRVTLETLIELLKQDVGHFMGPAKQSNGDGKAELPWDVEIPEQKPFLPIVSIDDPLRKASTLDAELPTEPLESYIELGEGYCVQQALLSWIIMRRFGFPARLVNGSTAIEPGLTFGHTWVSLADGRILDPALGYIMRPQPQTPKPLHYPTKLFDQNWFYIAEHKFEFNAQWYDMWRFEMQRYPILVRKDDSRLSQTIKASIAQDEIDEKHEAMSISSLWTSLWDGGMVD